MQINHSQNKLSEKESYFTDRNLATLFWIFRIALAGCFIGHGAFGIITKSSWLPYFSLVGIDSKLAYQLMPIIGICDISLGILLFFLPIRIGLWWALIWTLWTALLRPLTGEGIWEFLERAGNYGIPAAFLVFSSLRWRDLLSLATNTKISLTKLATVSVILRLTTAALLIGHGAFGLFMQKAGWYTYFSVLGIPRNTTENLSLLSYIGIFEIILGIIAFFISYSWFFYLCWFGKFLLKC